MPRNVDAQYLAALQTYYRRHRALPSMARIAELLGFASTGGVFELVGRLKDAGYLAQGPDRRLAPTKRFFERPLLGHVRAGRPEPVEEQLAGGINIDDALVQAPERTVLLRVKGDSMVEAGLRDGDTVVVERGSPARVGDIVVAFVDGEYTVKHLALDGEQFYLRAANGNYADLRPRDRLEVYGLVVGMFRTYGR